MICQFCKDNDHALCPAAKQELSFGTKRPSTGLSPEGDVIQRSGLCACHHKPWPVVAVVEAGMDFHEAIHHANAQVSIVGLTPPKCPMCEDSLVSSV